MSDAGPEGDLIPFIRTSQVIVGVQVVGLLTFLGFVLFLRAQASAPPGGPQEPAQSLGRLTQLAIGIAVAGMAASVLVPSLLVEAQRRRIARGTWRPPAGQREGSGSPALPAGDRGMLMSVYQTQKIVGVAIQEGIGFFALIAYLLEGQTVALLLALALILGMVPRFPTVGGAERWIDAQREQMARDHELGG